MNITEKIAKFRINLNWTEYELSQRSGLPQSTISSWYRKNSSPSLESLKKIADAFNISLSELISENPDYVYTNKEETELIEMYHSLLPAQRKKVISFIEHVCEQ